MSKAAIFSGVRVLLAVRLPDKLRELQEGVVRRGGGDVVSDVREATHLALEPDRRPSELACLAALPQAEWPRLVTKEWVGQCSKVLSADGTRRDVLLKHRHPLDHRMASPADSPARTPPPPAGTATPPRDGGAAAGAAGPSEPVEAVPATADPRCIVAWNCCGLEKRLQSQKDSSALGDFLATRCLPPPAAPPLCRLPPCHSLLSAAPSLLAAAPPPSRPRLASSSEPPRRRPDLLFLSEVKMAREHGDVSHCPKEEGDRRRILRAESTCLAGYECTFALGLKRAAGSAVLWRDGSAPRRLWRYLPDDLDAPPSDACDADGRVLLTEWPTLLMLHTYSPNVGQTSESYRRRTNWDARVAEWAEHAASWASARGLAVVYVGDLNCAPQHEDVTWCRCNPKNRRGCACPLDACAQGSGATAGWMLAQHPSATDDGGFTGQNGVSPNERRGFAELLRRGGLVDAFRHHHPAPAGCPPPDPFADDTFSYRGWPGNDERDPAFAKYYRRGMRIDHALVSAALLPRVVACNILGAGGSCAGAGFMGSDHAPIVLCLARGASPRAADIS